jgi:hypothetical protein
MMRKNIINKHIENASYYSQEAPPVVPGNGVDARGLGGDGVDGLEPGQVVECNPLGE